MAQTSEKHPAGRIPAVHPPTITDQAALEQLCQRLQQAPQIGIDTEFVSEDTFHPELCLIQIATAEELAVVDTMAVKDLKPFWDLLTQGDHVTIFHAGREELNFVLRAVDAVPRQMFDVQLASGFCCQEFPSAYGAIVRKYLNHKPRKGEQRTDWRRRPLTDAQIDYALEDVRYLLPLYEHLTETLSQSDRLDWFQDELERWRDEVIAARQRKDWRRVSGIGSLSPRSLAIVRELWLWRQQEAERLNKPPKRLLRDDLLVEAAKRKSDKPEQLMAIRGMQRGPMKQLAEEMAACVRRGLKAPVERMPKSTRTRTVSQLNLLGQFLTPALATICQRSNIAASLVGTATDVRELIAFRLDLPEAKEKGPPKLSRGWRAEVVGNLINELLDGKKSIRIVNANHEDPLVFDGVS